MKNAADTEDAVQDTFIKMIKSGKVFESAEHEKAWLTWLIRTAANICKDNLRNWWRKHENLEDFENLPNDRPVSFDDTLYAVLDLPDKYKTVVCMYYYEGYSSVEIAEMLNKPQSTIRSHLLEARIILKNKLGGDFE
jgi:RNA polymerase sigma-70 factor (ECF subfamily)